MQLSLKAFSSLLLLAVLVSCNRLPVIKNTPTDYEINLRFTGSDFNRDRQKVFIQAAQRWMNVIEADLQDIPIDDGDLPAGDDTCGFDTPAFAGTVDDLLIFASIEPIDGEGDILGRAGPAFIRTANNLTIVGCMQFDSADVESLEDEKTFSQVILHEMSHVLGFGSLWEESPSLLDEPCFNSQGATPGFRGTSSVLEFDALGETGNPPVENNGGNGTRCSHWDEDFFDNELMTGFLGGTTSATVNPLSRLTVASLEDLGYEVDLSQGETYAIPNCSPDCDSSTLKTSEAYEPWEIVLTPKGTIDKNGAIRLLEGR
jgi:hypothetical protein